MTDDKSAALPVTEARNQSYGWIKTEADDLRASYPEAVAFIEAEAAQVRDGELLAALDHLVNGVHAVECWHREPYDGSYLRNLIDRGVTE